MVDLPFGKITDKLNARFVIGVLLPCLTFSLLAVTVLYIGHGTKQSMHWWSSQATPVQVLLITTAFGLVMLVSWILGGQTAWLLRCAAGYWMAPQARWLYSIGRRRHQMLYSRLTKRARTDASAIETLYLYYPNRSADILPTQLGNALAALESYARTRYGLDLVLIWPRLFAVLPTRRTAAIAAARAELEIQLVTAALGVTFGLGVAVPLALFDAPVALLLGWFWGCLFVTYAGYRSAVASTVAYGQEVRCALDLHRLDLLTAVGMGEEGDERDLWRRLQEFWFQSIPLDAVRAPSLTSDRQQTAPSYGSPISLAVFALGSVAALTVILMLLR